VYEDGRLRLSVALARALLMDVNKQFGIITNQ
jgi:hypothetical protein